MSRVQIQVQAGFRSIQLLSNLYNWHSPIFIKCFRNSVGRALAQPIHLQALRAAGKNHELTIAYEHENK